MSAVDAFVVVVRFSTEPAEQPRALEEISAYIDTFLRLQPGFLGSFLQRDDDGREVLHFARWRAEADFRAFAAAAQQHPALPALRRYQPAAQFYRGVSRFDPEVRGRPAR